MTISKTRFLQVSDAARPAVRCQANRHLSGQSAGFWRYVAEKMQIVLVTDQSSLLLKLTEGRNFRVVTLFYKAPRNFLEIILQGVTVGLPQDNLVVQDR